MTTKLKESAEADFSLQKNIPAETTIVNFNAETLIAKAIEQGTPVETMERLLAMRKELKAEWAKEQFDKAMADFQKECPVIEKKKKVSFNTTNYSYAPLEEIVEQVKGLLAKNGFSYTFDTKEAENAIKVICYVKHIAGHSESSSLEIQIDSGAKMNRTQQYGSANSYGKRYAFCNAFGILTGDEDNDAQTPIEVKETRGLEEFTRPDANIHKTGEKGDICILHNKTIKSGKYGNYCGTKELTGRWCQGWVNRSPDEIGQTIVQKAEEYEIDRIADEIPFY